MHFIGEQGLNITASGEYKVVAVCSQLLSNRRQYLMSTDGKRVLPRPHRFNDFHARIIARGVYADQSAIL